MRWLVVIGTLYVAATTLSGLFVNIYIWKVDHSFLAVGLFNWTLYASLPVAFLAGGFFSVRVGELWMMRAGVAFIAGFFSVLLVFAGRSAHHASWLGALFGVGQGFFWYGYNVLAFDLTNEGNRGRFGGLSGLFGSLAGTVAPFAAGCLISQGKQFSGYMVVFALSLALFAALVAVSFRITPRRRPGQLQIREGFRLRREPDWRRIWLGSCVFGMREGLFAFFIGLLVYLATKSEMGLGEYGLYTGAISLGAFYAAGRFIRTQRAGRVCMFLAGTGLGATALVFLISVNRTTLILFGSLTALLFPFLQIPWHVLVMNEIDESKRSRRFRSEHLISREIALGIGRVIGVGSFLAICQTSPDEHRFLVLLAVLGFAFLGAALLVRRVNFVSRAQQAGAGTIHRRVG